MAKCEKCESCDGYVGCEDFCSTYAAFCETHPKHEEAVLANAAEEERKHKAFKYIPADYELKKYRLKNPKKAKKEKVKKKEETKKLTYEEEEELERKRQSENRKRWYWKHHEEALEYQRRRRELEREAYGGMTAAQRRRMQNDALLSEKDYEKVVRQRIKALNYYKKNREKILERRRARRNAELETADTRLAGGMDV